jgi:hypothetical protein
MKNWLRDMRDELRLMKYWKQYLQKPSMYLDFKLCRWVPIFHGAKPHISKPAKALLRFIWFWMQAAEGTYSHSPNTEWLETRIKVLELREEARQKERIKQLNAMYDSLPEPTEIDPDNDTLPSTENLLPALMVRAIDYERLRRPLADPWLSYKRGDISRDVYNHICWERGLIPLIPLELQESPRTAYDSGMISQDEWRQVCIILDWPENDDEEDEDDDEGWED